MSVIIKTRSIPSNPRSKNYPAGTTLTPSSGGSPTIIGGGGTSIDIVGESSGKTLTDKNVLSSLRVIAEILSRIIKSDDDTELSEEKTLSSIRIIDEILSRIIKSGDTTTELSEENTFSTKRSKTEFVSKKYNDAVAGFIEFLNGIDITNGLSTDTLTGTEITTQLLSILDKLVAKTATFSGDISSKDYVMNLLGWLIGCSV